MSRKVDNCRYTVVSERPVYSVAALQAELTALEEAVYSAPKVAHPFLHSDYLTHVVYQHEQSHAVAQIENRNPVVVGVIEDTSLQMITGVFVCGIRRDLNPYQRIEVSTAPGANDMSPDDWQNTGVAVMRLVRSADATTHARGVVLMDYLTERHDAAHQVQTTILMSHGLTPQTGVVAFPKDRAPIVVKKYG